MRKIKRWRQKRQEQKAIQYGFRIARSIIPNVEYGLKRNCLDALTQLIDDYCAAWGNDTFSQFYRGRLDYLQLLPCKGLSM